MRSNEEFEDETVVLLHIENLPAPAEDETFTALGFEKLGGKEANDVSGV